MSETLIELALIAAAAVRVGWLLGRPGARRLFAAEPALAWAAAAALAGGATLVVVAATRPAWLRALTLLVAVAWLALAWRARPRFGARLPPGSLSLTDSLAALVERDFLARRAKRLGPVFKMAQFHQPVACVVGLARCRALLQRHASALAPPPLPLSAEIPRGFLRYMTPDDHERYARLFRAAFSERTLTASRPAVERDARAALAAICRDGPARRPDADRFLLPALNRILFGTLLSADDLEIVAQCGRDATFATATGRPTARAKAALARFVALLATRRDSHDAGDESSVWAELIRREPQSVRDPTVLGNLFLLLEASRDSIGGLLLWSLQRLGEHPAWCDWLRQEPTADGVSGESAGAGLDRLTGFVLETLRLAQSEYLYRRTLAPIEVDGFHVPRGWLVRLCVAESHRLDPPFADPECFDPERHRRRRYGPDELSPFGLDRHACLGARLTLFLARLFLAELVAAYDLSPVDAGPAERAPRHWTHWAPSRRLRVALTPRAERAADADILLR